MINMLRSPIDKVGSMQEQMGSISKEKEMLRKNQKEMLEIKNTVAEMTSAFDGLISGLHMAEDVSIKSL